MGEYKEDFADQLGLFLTRAGLTQQALAKSLGVHRNTIGKWLNRTSRPDSRAQTLRMADALVLSKEERKELIEAAGFILEWWPTEVWTVPQSRDQFFTGREELLESLHKLLAPGSMTSIPQAISGLGGLGKTHTAVEYAHRFHQQYDAVLWLLAASWDDIVSSCLQLTHELDLPKLKETDQVVAQVQRWLYGHRHWLLILDNLEDSQTILPKIVPPTHQGSVLITTQMQDIEPLAQTHLLSKMSEQEGVLFLLRRTKRIPASDGLEHVRPREYKEAKQLWQLLDGLPLALDQAGAYILETAGSFSGYQEQYTRRHAELLQRRGKRFIGHEASVSPTFSLAFEKVEQANQVAATLLKRCAFFSPESISENLLRDQIWEENTDEPPLLPESLEWEEAIGELLRYSLVRRDPALSVLSIHRVVQAVLKGEMDEKTYQKLAQLTVRVVNHAFPEVGFDNWQVCQEMLPHARMGAALIEENLIHIEEACRLLNEAGHYLFVRGQYSEAEQLHQHALTIGREVLISNGPILAFFLSNLALDYRSLGKYEQAEPLAKEALTIREQQLGLEHPDTAQSLNNLADLYHAQGKDALAEPLFKQALAVREKILKADDPYIASTLVNLASLYRGQEKYDLAEPLFERALGIFKKTLGEDHFQVAICLNNLAKLYTALSRYAEAEEFYRQALKIYEKAQEAGHPELAAILTNLAELCYHQERYSEAISLMQRALSITEEHLGAFHPYTAVSLDNLATLFRVQGSYTEAEQLQTRALAIWDKILGGKHPNIAYSLNNLADLYEKQERFAEAEQLYKQALEIRQEQLGADHFETARSLSNLANLYAKQSRYAEAEQLYQRALAIFQQQSGPKHPDTLAVQENYQDLLRKQGRDTEAALFETDEPRA